ncbi:MAG TPA: AI-2E family transporter [Vicinamibacterales bacterium]|nr:AI-2E family transporter [Vicinamibacterales bacterium]
MLPGAVEKSERMTDDDQLAGYDEPPAGATPAASHPVPPPSAPESRTLVGLAVTAIVVAALYLAQDVLVPITLAVMLSFVLSPLTNGLRRIGLWRGPAVILSVVLALAVIGALGTLIGSQAAGLAEDAPRYAEAIEQKIEGAQALATARLGFLLRVFGAPGEPAVPAPAAPPQRPATTRRTRTDTALATQQQPVLVELARPRTSALTVARTILEPVLAPLETTFIVLIVAVFVLMQKQDLRDRFIRVFGSTDLHRTTLALDEAGQRLSRFFLSQLAVNASFGLVIGLGLWAIGIPTPALWGGLAGLLRFVPYIGPLLGAVPPLALGAAIEPGWSTTAAVALLFVVVEPLTGYVVEPLLYGHSTGLSPASVIVAAIFWTWLWGPIGLILSTPLTLCLVVMGRHVRSLEFFDVLLGDRPPLSAIDTFYQRILGDNPDDALANAESMLADRTLLDYYDSVVLPALKLAAADEATGKLSHERPAEMSRSVLAVIDELCEHVDVGSAPPAGQAARSPARTGAAVCVAGRGPFDDAVAAMLAQLLAHRGVTSRSVPHTAVSREAIAELDVADVAVFVVSYLELAGTPTRLRSLVKRLRAHAPAARIVVGLWPEGDATLSDVNVQRALGADAYVGSLRAAVDATLAALPHAG